MSNELLKVNIQKKLKEFDLNVDFELKKGCLGILGPSGCGKSMTLKSVAGIVNPDNGVISLTTNDETVYYDSNEKINLNKTYSLNAYNNSYSEISHTITTPHNTLFVLNNKKIKSCMNKRIQLLIFYYLILCSFTYTTKSFKLLFPISNSSSIFIPSVLLFSPPILYTAMATCLSKSKYLSLSKIDIAIPVS